MYKKILVGIDDSKHAERTLKRAHELQKRLNSELIVFYSVEHKMIPDSIIMPGLPFSSPYRIPVDDYKKIRQAYIDKGKQIIEKAKKIIGKDNPKVEFRLITEEKPEDYALITSKKENIDLIMLGSKGDHNVIEKLMGSVSEKVLNEAECDMIIVK